MARTGNRLTGPGAAYAPFTAKEAAPETAFWCSLTGQSGQTAGGDIKEIGLSITLAIYIKEILKCLLDK